MSTKVLIIHGGNTYPSKEAFVENLLTREVQIDRMRHVPGWRETLQDALGKDFDVLLPRMPFADNAEYDLWKFWFEKVFDAADAPQILIGHSLGAMFLLKYYSERKNPIKIKHLLLVAPQYSDTTKNTEEVLSFVLPDDLSNVVENTEHLEFFYSEDDPVISFENMACFKEKIPNARYHIFTDRGHFNGERFPELVASVKEEVCDG